MWWLSYTRVYVFCALNWYVSIRLLGRRNNFVHDCWKFMTTVHNEIVSRSSWRQNKFSAMRCSFEAFIARVLLMLAQIVLVLTLFTRQGFDTNICDISIKPSAFKFQFRKVSTRPLFDISVAKKKTSGSLFHIGLLLLSFDYWRNEYFHSTPLNICFCIQQFSFRRV